MPKLLEKYALLNDLAAVNDLLSGRSDDDDPMGRLAYEDRKKDLEKKLTEIEPSRDTLGSVALIFSGDPVDGSRAISAAFATEAVSKYQDIVAKLYGDKVTDGLAEKGSIPHRDLSSLQITNIAHGSFGFILEEKDIDSPGLFDSPLKEMLDESVKIIGAFYSTEENYTAVLESINKRVFSSVKEFYATLHKSNAAIRIVEGEVDQDIDPGKVETAYERSQRTTVEENEEERSGILIGVVPTAMQFEFQPDEGDAIVGKTGPAITRTYLERIKAHENTVGSRCTAKILTRTITRPTGQVSRKYMLLDLSIS